MSREDHALIVDLVNAHRSGLAELVEYPKMDHGFYIHESMAASFQESRSGRFNEEVATKLLEWRRRILPR